MCIRDSSKEYFNPDTGSLTDTTFRNADAIMTFKMAEDAAFGTAGFGKRQCHLDSTEPILGDVNLDVCRNSFAHESRVTWNKFDANNDQDDDEIAVETSNKPDKCNHMVGICDSKQSAKCIEHASKMKAEEGFLDENFYMG